MVVMIFLLLEDFMIDYCSWCRAPETNCPRWIGLYCELVEEEIILETLEKYLELLLREKGI